MTELVAENLLLTTFTPSEREFLFSNPQFKEAVASSTKEDLTELSKLGVHLLLTRGYTPPPPAPDPGRKFSS